MDNDLVSNNLGLVHSCCKRFTGRGTEYDDLFQIGCIGLIKAAEKFDCSLGFAFSTYAVPAILGELRRYFRDNNLIKVSRETKELQKKIVSVREELIQKKGRDITVNELASQMNMSVEDTVTVLASTQPILSLTVSNDDGEIQNDVPISDNTNEILQKLTVEKAMNCLNEDDRKIISLRYYSQMTQSQTAEILGMTQVQVSRKEKKILNEIKKHLA